MKMGLESEMILYDTRQRSVSHTAFRILDALNDFRTVYGAEDIDRVMAEFVLNIIEINSSPSAQVMHCARDYLFSYELVRDVASRSGVVPLPLASYPVPFTPIMATKWQYLVQNAVLSGSANVGWALERGQKLFPASNCAGVHMHMEIQTPSEFTAFTDELLNKHNLAAMLVPLAAFASSPWFDGVHEAQSMRALRYFFGVYRDVPECGGMPPVFRSSAEVVRFYHDGVIRWIARGIEAGIDAQEMHRLTVRVGASWGMVRWNRKWNTVEMRFLDTDFVDMNLGRFAIAAGVFGCLSKGVSRIATLESECADRPDAGTEVIDAELSRLLRSVFSVKAGTLYMLPEVLLHRLIMLSITEGLANRMVYRYLVRMTKFATRHLSTDELWLCRPVLHALKERKTTADWVLRQTGDTAPLRPEKITSMLEAAVVEEQRRRSQIQVQMPANLQPPGGHPFPQGNLELWTRDWQDWEAELRE